LSIFYFSSNYFHTSDVNILCKFFQWKHIYIYIYIYIYIQL
jgi:hypothetical protein